MRRDGSSTIEEAVCDTAARFSSVLVGYLFGSVASGLCGPFCDIDVAVLLDRHPTSEEVAGEAQDALCRALRTDLADLVSLNRAPSSLAYRVIRDGRLVCCRDAKAREAFESGTVLRDGGMFRMWYYACHRGMSPDWPPRKMQQVAKKPSWLIGVAEGYEVCQGPLCYAESDDGIAWRKPELGQVLFKGCRANNAIELPHTIVSGAAVIRDDADPDPARRYKMVYQYFPDQTEPRIVENGNLPSMACAVSSDGLAWTVTAMPFVNQFVEHCSFIRHGGKYIVHSQVFPGSGWSGAYTEGGAGGGRTGIAHATYDFDHWPDLWEWAFALPEPRERAEQRGAAWSLRDLPDVGRFSRRCRSVGRFRARRLRLPVDRDQRPG